MTDSREMHDLSRRASTFVRSHGNRVFTEFAQDSADSWVEQGIDGRAVRRAVEHELQWGNLYLPPSIAYDGGPRYLGSEMVVGEWARKGCIEAGPPRCSTSYGFLIDEGGSFGIGEVEFVPLYKSVEGWVEALALEYELRRLAKMTRRLSGPELASLDLSSMAPFPGIPGVADSWLIEDDSIVRVVGDGPYCRCIQMMSLRCRTLGLWNVN